MNNAMTAADRFETLRKADKRRAGEIQAHVRNGAKGGLNRAFRLALARGEINRYGYRTAELARKQAMLTAHTIAFMAALAAKAVSEVRAAA